jgi:SAM-dependent methyltransferase
MRVSLLLIIFISSLQLNAKSSVSNLDNCFAPFSVALNKDPFDKAMSLVQKRRVNNLPVIVDLGGEGRYLDAININPYFLTSTTGEPNRFIPNWVYGLADEVPLSNRTVDLLYLENAPLSIAAMEEILRVIRPRGKIRLSHPSDYAERYFDDLADIFQGHQIKVNQNGSITKIDITIKVK